MFQRRLNGDQFIGSIERICTYIGRVCGRGAKREMIEQVPYSEILAGLRDKLGTLHLGVPCRSRVNGYPKTVSLCCIGWILVARRESEVVGRWASSVDIPLIGSHFIRPRPYD